MAVSASETDLWPLALCLLPRVGSRRLARWQSKLPKDDWQQMSRQDWLSVGLDDVLYHALIHSALPNAQQILDWQTRGDKQGVIHWFSDQYPMVLRTIASAPTVLFYHGEGALLSFPQLAIVGSRNASEVGRNDARRFAGDLASKGLVITSGMAIGIDGYAHDGALSCGQPTIAVLGSGFNHIYPKQHTALYERIVEHGVVVSEFSPDTKPHPRFFPRRNRIISGLSMGVFVVEASEKSGSLVTARYALEQGREVFALPGSIHHPSHRGSNRLIQEGAKLVQGSDDIFSELHAMHHWLSQQLPLSSAATVDENNSQQQLPFAELLANVGSEATPVDILAERTHIPVQEVMSQLLELELLGIVVSVAGGYIRSGRS